MNVVQRTINLQQLTARDNSTTPWVVSSLMKCAIRQARPPVPATAIRILDIFSSFQCLLEFQNAPATWAISITKYKCS
jgi:hypothetical protein